MRAKARYNFGSARFNPQITSYPLILAALLTACGPRPGALAPLPADAIVLAFGDSLTYASGTEPENSYPAVLERISGLQVINAGQPGELTQEGLERLPALLDQYHPDLVIICHGGNDLLQKRDEGQIADNIRSMIRLAQQSAAGVVLIGVPKPGLVLTPAKFYSRIAKEFAIPYEEHSLAAILSRSKFKSDMIHPNAQGYRILAEAIAALLKKEQILAAH